MVGGAIPEVRNDTGELPILHEPSRPSRIISWAEDWPGPSRAAVWPTVRCCGPRPTCWPGEEQAKARVRPALPCLRRVRRRPGPGEPRCARPAAPARLRPGPGRATRIQPRPPLRSHRQPPLPVPPFRIWAGPAPEAPLGTPQPSVGLHAAPWMATEMATASCSKRRASAIGEAAPPLSSQFAWWAGTDLNRRRRAGRFTVCSLWPLGHRPRGLRD